MRRWFCLMAVAIAVAWGCSPTARNRVMHFFFEIPDEGASASESDDEAGGSSKELPTISMPDTRFASLHEPVRVRNCSACHDSESQMEVRDDFIDACEECHPRFFSDEVEHGPVLEGECMECHTGHRSKLPHLLVDKAPDVCTSCHDGPEDLSEEAHGGPDAEQCLTCHDPHFGESPFLRSSEE